MSCGPTFAAVVTNNRAAAQANIPKYEGAAPGATRPSHCLYSATWALRLLEERAVRVDDGAVDRRAALPMYCGS